MTFALHHVAFASPHAAEAVDFYVKDWGLRDAGRDDGAVHLAAALDAADDYSLVIKPSEQKAVDHFCLVSEDEAAVDSLEERARKGGARVLEDAPACRGLARAFQVIDIDGRRVEIGYRPGAGAAVGEVADAVPLKAAHIVLNTPDIDAATGWYQEKLGFGLRDWREHQMSFLYYNADHHTVAFNSAPHASLNHVAWEIADINQFFRAAGRAGGTELGEKLYGPGRHGPGDYVFYYFLDPTGFICEYETDSIRIPDPGDYQFRVWKWSAESADQWLGTLSGGMPSRFRERALGEPDPALQPTGNY
jgi:catechol 2,3-dioxygenase-like lactoylglutathione lyase family enzyme